jgi:glycosyltransferase involved in cell wall biosynthesis
MVPTTVAILTNVLPSYRAGFYDRLFSRQDLTVDVYCQSHLPGMNVRTIHDRYPDRVRIVKALSADREAIVWQHLPWRRILFSYDVVFVDGNPRIVSHALAATLLRMLRRNVVLWTMGHSYRSNSVTEQLRLRWTRMFRSILLYTDPEVESLRRRRFSTNYLNATNNGLDQQKIDTIVSTWDQSRLMSWRRSKQLDGRTLVLSCSRLDPKNRFDLLIEALPAISRAVPNVLWCAIGGGPEQVRLMEAAAAAGVADRVRFVGELYEESELAPWFLSAQLFIHPGAIGLSLFHAFGYGLPVVTHGRAERHGPEFCAFVDEATGRIFRDNDAGSLAETVIGLLSDSAALEAMKTQARNVVRQRYNVDVMVERFVETAKHAASPL